MFWQSDVAQRRSDGEPCDKWALIVSDPANKFWLKAWLLLREIFGSATHASYPTSILAARVNEQHSEALRSARLLRAPKSLLRTFGHLSWTPKMRQVAKVEPCP
jgi:hypothetical protein